MKTTATLAAMCGLLISMLAILWLLEYREIAPYHALELTVEKKALLKAAWKRHGYFTTIESVEGIYMESPKGRIWIERKR